MIRNRFLSPKTAADIERRVDLVLRGFGDTRPPLNLYGVRKYLGLGLGFYADGHLGATRRTVSRIRIATLRTYRRPVLVAEAIRKYDLSALYLSEPRRILLDSSLPEKKRRWNVAHEIAHRLIPWHDDLAYGDNRHTPLSGMPSSNRDRSQFRRGAAVVPGQAIRRGSTLVPAVHRIRLGASS